MRAKFCIQGAECLLGQTRPETAENSSAAIGEGIRSAQLGKSSLRRNRAWYIHPLEFRCAESRERLQEAGTDDVNLEDNKSHCDALQKEMTSNLPRRDIFLLS